MKTIDELVDALRKLPGIGPRHAKRIAYALLSADNAIAEHLGSILLRLKKGVGHCVDCSATFFKEENSDKCSVCNQKNRDKNLLIIIAHDIDREAIEKSRLYQGNYCVIGKTIPLGDRNPEVLLPKDMMFRIIDMRIENGLSEIILGFNATPEGEHTGDIIHSLLSKKYPSLTISRLGRGLSTGTELEYSDGETLRYALSRREK